MSEAEQVTRIVLSFFIALAIVFFTSKLIGKERKARWFKKRRHNSFFTRRGFLGDSCYFGVPCKWQGIVIALLMVGGIGIISYLLLFVL
ncbi:MAG: hypothetical protein ABFC84_14395 [Veillonellales bacterium]